MWLEKPTCVHLTNSSWVELAFGCTMLSLQHKLKQLKFSLKSWKRTEFGNIHSVVLQKKIILLDIQQKLDAANSQHKEILIS